MLIDSYNRVVDNLRVLVTSRCNLDCFFCHREGSISSEELTPEDIAFVVSEATKLGVSGVKLTGGEPLLREDIVEIVSLIANIRGVRDLSMTTNGTLLERYAEDLKKAGLQRVNISIHSLRREVYRSIVGRDLLKEALRGLNAAVEAGLRVKINFVLLKGLNESEIPNLVKLAKQYDLKLQIIELEPIGKIERSWLRYHLGPSKVVYRAIPGVRKRHRRRVQNRPVLKTESGLEVEIVSPLETPGFCLGCNRLRLSPDGVLKPCIFSVNEGVDLKPYIRERDPKGLRKGFVKVMHLRRPHYLPWGG